ncbi:MAG: TraR/DksA family transcriptional regulator [Saprospiraceae bacterium]|nr:TraR/DksA family transcriptional regulator [Saprospiraceae bacterium]
MTIEEKKVLKSRLESKIKRTRVKIERMEEMTQPIGPENAIGRVSRMDAINNKSVMEAALRSSRKELDEMESAWRHIDNDPNFGKCERCHNEIPFKRLAVMPGSRYCVHCA